mgnify:CR=1 FL=1
MVENLSLNKWISSTFNNWSELKNETQSVVHQILSNNTRDLEFFEAIKYELEKIYLATWYDYADYDTRLLANETDVKKVINEQVLTWKIKTLYHALLHWKDQKTKNQIKQWLYNDYFYDLWVIFNTNYCKPINENINYSEIKINAKNIISNPLLIKEMNFISFEWFKDENLTKEDENKLLKSLKENTASLKWLSIWRWMIEMNLDFLIELFNSIPNNIDLLNLSWILDSCIINNEEYYIFHKDKYKRRIDRLYNNLNSKQNVLLILYEYNTTTQQFSDFIDCLKRQHFVCNLRLLIFTRKYSM